jgi:hypothetical protein
VSLLSGSGRRADRGEPALQFGGVQFGDRQLHQLLDARLDRAQRRGEGGAALGLAFDRGGIGQAPVRADGPAGPDRAGLARGAVAERDDEIELGRARRGELVPALGAEGETSKPSAASSSSAAGFTCPRGVLPAL